MTEIDFATTAVTGPEKIDAWRTALANVFGPFEVRPTERGNFSGRVRCFGRAQIQFNEVYYRWQTGERTPANIAHLPRESHILTRPLLGPLRVERNGREYLLTPGNLYLFDQSRPFRFTSNAGYEAFSVSLPSAALRLREPKVGQIYRVSLGDGSPRGQLLRHYIDYVAAGIRTWSDAEVVGLSEHLFDLIVLLMVHEGKTYTSQTDTAVTAAHRERAIAYIQAHLSDADLRPTTIAGAIGLSVRYLHQVFGAAALKVEDFLYTQRLEKCRELLLDARYRQKSVSRLAYQVGFRHPSHFSRLFKRRYGTSPRAFRFAHLRAPSASDAVGK